MRPPINTDFYNQTTLHPLGVAAILLLGVITLLAPRRYALAPMLVMACFISSAQRVVILSLDFSLLRLLVLFAWVRVLSLAETRGFRLRTPDVIVLLWVVVGSVTSVLREASVAEAIYRCGLSFDALGLYFLFRILIRDFGDVEAIVRVAALLSLPAAAVFFVEHVTGRNMFSIFGGVDAITQVRDGRIRCRGPFAHPIYAGCFWASLAPLIGALWWGNRSWRWLAPVGVAAAILIIFTTASSTPVLALAAAVFATCLFPLRRRLAWIRLGTVTALLTLHVAMQAPVWHLIARMDVVGGSTGWYRYRLIDGFIRGFDQWWLAGTRLYADLWGPSYKAITNHFILEGVEGGFAALCLFVAFIALAFRGVGRLRLRVEPLASRLPTVMTWALGSCLFVHCAAFLAVSYFGQVLMVWYLPLAVVTTLTPVSHPRSLLHARRSARTEPRRRVRLAAGPHGGRGELEHAPARP